MKATDSSPMDCFITVDALFELGVAGLFQSLRCLDLKKDQFSEVKNGVFCIDVDGSRMFMLEIKRVCKDARLVQIQADLNKWERCQINGLVICLKRYRERVNRLDELDHANKKSVLYNIGKEIAEWSKKVNFDNLEQSLVMPINEIGKNLNQLLDQLIIFKPNNLICEIIGIIFHDSIILKKQLPISDIEDKLLSFKFHLI